jgi:hypothetical protein
VSPGTGLCSVTAVPLGANSIQVRTGGNNESIREMEAGAPNTWTLAET